jgi:hypothetical protein
MKGYKEPGFQDRAARAAEAKKTALARLKAAPKLDEAEIAARAARQLEKDAKAAAKREAVRAAREQAMIEERERRAAEKLAAEAAKPPVLTEAERKAARDARYAARKKRKS